MKTASFLLWGTTCIVTPLAAIAQQDPTAAPEIITLEPITLTAQYREETPQEIPISVFALGPDEVAEKGSTRLDQVLPMIPNAAIATTRGGIEATNLSLRGVTTTAYGADPSVAVYLDGVYVGADSAFDADIVDLEAVEVLQGPQGTLSGHNALGGSIILRTASPEIGLTDTGVELGYASHNGRRLSLRGNIATGAHSALRYSFKRELSDGWIRNRAGGPDRDSLDAVSGRVKWLAEIGDNWTSEIALDYSKDKGRRFAFGPIASVLDDGISVEQPFDERVKNQGVSWRNVWQTGFGQVESITAWRSSDSTLLPGAYNGPVFDLRDSTRDYHQLTQELRATGTTERLDWSLGLFAMRSEDERSEGILYTVALPADTVGPGQPELPAGYGETSHSQIDSTTIAAYADGAWSINDRLKLVGGLRVSHDRKKIHYHHDNNQGLPFALLALQQDLHQSVSGTHVSPRLGLTWDLDPDTTLYGMISSGYKPASFNTAFAASDDLKYDKETAVNYELGVKGNAWDGRMNYAVSVFYLDWRDQQVYSLNQTTGILSITNAPKSRSKGAEISLDAQVTDALLLGTALGYNDAVFKDYPNALNGDAAGNRQPLSSKYNIALRAEYRNELPSGYELGLDASYQWRSKFWFDAENTLSQDAYGVANLGLSLRSDNWTLRAYVDNLTDEQYLRAAATILAQGGALGYPGAERTFGLTFSATF